MKNFSSISSFILSIAFFLFGSVGIQAQTSLNLETNSGVEEPQIRLVETETGFARISWENVNTPGKFWTIAGLTNNVGSSRLNFYYDGGATASDLMTIHGDNKTIGIGTSAPKYELDIQQDLPSPGTGTGPWGGLNINGGTDNDWTLFAFSNIFDFYYKNVLKGRISGVDGSYTPMSDIRLKESIESISTPQLENIRKLQPVVYHMKDDQDRQEKASGFIAQAVREVYPNLVVSGATKDSYLSLNYTAMIPYLVKGIQELAECNDALAEQLRLIQAELKAAKTSK